MGMNSMTRNLRRSGIAFLASLVVSVALEPVAHAGGDDGPPNILIILLDDLGNDQLRCYDERQAAGLAPGSNLYPPGAFLAEYAPTPNITELARDGIRFTRAFSSPVCSPSRASIMTGRYPFRNQIGSIVTPDGISRPPGDGVQSVPQQFDLPASEVTLPELLKLAPNYRKAWFGKWHLARDPSSESGVGSSSIGPTITAADVPGDEHPVMTGWDFYQGVMHNSNNRPNPAEDTFDPVLLYSLTGTIVPLFAGYRFWYRVTSLPSPDPTFGPTITSRVSSDPTIDHENITLQQRIDVETWILEDANIPQQQPWLAVWAATAPHGPWQYHPPGTPNEGQVGPALDVFRETLTQLDTEIGVLKANLIAALGQAAWDNTVVILVGDNGTPVAIARFMDDQGVPLFPYVAEWGSCAMPGTECNPGTAASTCDDLRVRFKGSPYLSGTNVPLIVSGPESLFAPPTMGQLPRNNDGLKGSTNDHFVDIVDLFETVRELAGIPSQWLPTHPDNTDPANYVTDSISLVPLLDASGSTTRDSSLSLTYIPNGDFCNRITMRLGFTMDVGTKTYRLIRRRDPVSGTETDEFYELSDSMTGPVIPPECDDLVASDSNYLVVKAALDALLPSCP